MTAARLRTAAAKLREEGGARNVAVANWLDSAADDWDNAWERHWPRRAAAAANRRRCVHRTFGCFVRRLARARV